MSHLPLTQTLADAFNGLADEVQALADRRTVLEHKLRFAHEQFQYLADKYAPAAPEIAETLAKLHLAPHTSVDDTRPVPLPARNSQASQHQLALLIRDGRRAASQLASSGEASKTTGSPRTTVSRTSNDDDASSMSTALEQDFTVEGRKGNLQCPFQKPVDADLGDSHNSSNDVEAKPKSSHYSGDPLCAAMEQSSTSDSAAANGTTRGSKCPIRYMDKHSPEEIAQYVETHKHELPRSHAVCLRRYQRNELQMRKLDSKYGDIVSMIEGLSQLHQPMLPGEEAELQDGQMQDHDAEGQSNERVETWAQGVSVTTDPDGHHEESQDQGDRESRFDRPLKEVRVGESPSRPWGISVPVYETSGPEGDHPFSPPPAPVRMPNNHQAPQTPPKGPSKCPFDHTKLAAAFAGAPKLPKQEEKAPQTPTPAKAPAKSAEFSHQPYSAAEPPPGPSAAADAAPKPAFLNPDAAKASGSAPQMLFTGPVFIGYSMEQALQFMNAYNGK